MGKLPDTINKHQHWGTRTGKNRNYSLLSPPTTDSVSHLNHQPLILPHNFSGLNQVSVGVRSRGEDFNKIL